MRRNSIRTGIAAATVALALTGLGTAAATAATAAAPVAATAEQVATATLAGNWNGVGDAGGKPVQPYFTFHYDGTLEMVPADNAYEATGAWTQTGSTFTFSLDHPIYNANGDIIFWIHGTQAGTVDGDTWTSSGQSGRYDTAGNLIETFTVTLAATRA